MKFIYLIWKIGTNNYESIKTVLLQKQRNRNSSNEEEKEKPLASR